MDYYEILGLSSLATLEEINDAYNELIQPFKATGTYGDTEECNSIIDAFEILGESRSRYFYDRYGHLGVTLMDTYFSRFLEPSTLLTSIKFLCLRSFAVLSLILHLSWLGQKMDKKSQLSFWIVFLPLYSASTALIFTLMYIVYCGKKMKLRSPGYLEFISPWLGDNTRNPTLNRFLSWHYSQLAQLLLALVFFTAACLKLELLQLLPYSLVITPLMCVFYLQADFPSLLQVFIIGLKMDLPSLSDVSWLVVCIPTFVSLICDLMFNVAICLTCLFIFFKDPGDSFIGRNKIRLKSAALESILISLISILIRSSFMILMSLKLDGTISRISFLSILIPFQMALGLLLAHSLLVAPVIITLYYLKSACDTVLPQPYSQPAQFTQVVEWQSAYAQYNENTPLIGTNNVLMYGEN